jgi:hypothetical protein
MRASFIDTQYQLAGHLRAPSLVAPPPDIEARRLAIYRDLIYNNIENFIATGFPVLRSLLQDEHWHGLVRGFIREHRSQSPYFLDIGREFLQWLQEGRVPESWDPPFLLELCHYEWVELALDIAMADIPANAPDADPLNRIVELSPLVRRLSYSFPVHKISASHQPQEPLPGGAHLVVYRNRADQVRFLEVNPVVISLLQHIDSKKLNGHDVLLALAADMGCACDDSFIRFGAQTLNQLVSLDVLVVS